MTSDELVDLVNQELNKKVKDLQEENRRLKQACKGDYEASQEIMGELKEEINKLSHLVANKVTADYDYDSVLKRELNEERRKNIVLTESKNMTEKENKELKEMYSNLENKYLENKPCCNEDDCGLYKEHLKTKNILTSFEKWLEEQNPTNSNENFVGIRLADIKNKLQELKGDIK